MVEALYRKLYAIRSVIQHKQKRYSTLHIPYIRAWQSDQLALIGWQSLEQGYIGKYNRWIACSLMEYISLENRTVTI
jgi:hypothetical protein